MQWPQFNSLIALTAYEVRRTRWAWLVGGVVLAAYALAEFAVSLAVTESTALRVTFYAASVRLGLVVALCLLVIVNTVRDEDDKFLHLMLSRPLGRPWWVLAKFTGYALAGSLAALVAVLPLCLMLSPVPALAWGFALACELTLMSAAALTAALSLSHVALAFCAVSGFYLLSRAMQAIVLLTHDSLLAPLTSLQQALAWGVQWLSYGLPDLARFTQSTWLIYAAPSPIDLGFVATETVLYGSLLLVVGMCDFQRRNL